MLWRTPRRGTTSGITAFRSTGGTERFGAADVPSEQRLADLENSLTQVQPAKGGGPGDPWLDRLADWAYLFGVSSCVRLQCVSPRSPCGSRQPGRSTAATPTAGFGRHKGAPAAFVGVVYAEDEEGAIAAAIEEHKVRQADQWRLFARPR